MPQFIQRLKEYYRQKRIRRILKFYYTLQPQQTVQIPPSFPKSSPEEEMLRKGISRPISKGKVAWISRDAKIHFFLTLSLWFVTAIPMQMIIKDWGIFGKLILVFLAWGIVELVDLFMDRMSKALDAFFDVILPVLVVVTCIGIFIGLKFFNLKDVVKNKVDSINDEMRSKPETAMISPKEGKNWKFYFNEKQELQPLAFDEAMKYCIGQGQGWGVMKESNTTTLDPAPYSTKYFYIWVMRNNYAMQPGQVGKGEIKTPSVWTSFGPGSKHVTLCVKE